MGKYSIPVWQMIVNSIQNEKRTNEYLTISQIRNLVQKYYLQEKVNPRTIELQVVFHTVNHNGNKHSGGLHVTNPLFIYDGKDAFRLLTEDEKRNTITKN